MCSLNHRLFEQIHVCISLSPPPAFWGCYSNRACSRQCVVAYMKRYDVPPHTCEIYARIHMGGPNGMWTWRATNFWTKVNAMLHENWRVLEHPVDTAAGENEHRRRNYIDVDYIQIKFHSNFMFSVVLAEALNVV